jgi:phospholipase C
MALINSSSKQASPMPVQEKGTRPACASPYELYADFSTNAAGELQLTMQAGNTFFGKSAAGAPFQVHNTGHYKGQLTPPRAYAVKPGDKLSDNWQLAAFDQDGYELRVYGPNGFYRAIAGKKLLPSVQVSALYEVKGKKPTGNLVLHISNPGKEAAIVVMRDNAYGNPLRELVCAPGLTKHRVELGRQHGWYDFTLLQQDAQPVSWQYAGHVDTGKTSRTDPQMA